MEENNLSLDRITFGKYTNRTIKEMIRDRKYCEWLLKQDWFCNYEYIYNYVNNYKPIEFFLKTIDNVVGNEDEKEEDVERKVDSGVDDDDDNTIENDVDYFLTNYKYFTLKTPDEVTILNENEKLCYQFYLEQINELKHKVIIRHTLGNCNPYDIKAPSKWLQKFESYHLEKGLKRDVFREFLSAYDLPNIPSIVEDIKKQGGLTYDGAQSFKIGKKRSEEQENYWEEILKNKYHEMISVQFKYMNCIFDFINISTNTIYECKLGLKDFNEEQYQKYQLVTNDKYHLKYLIGRDCVIDLDIETIYTTNIKEYILYQVNIPLLKTQSYLDNMIFDFDIVEVSDLSEIL